MKIKTILIICAICLFTLLAYSQIYTPSLISFNAGQVSPKMEGRSDYQKYNSACRILENMLVRKEGPVQRRPGTRYIADANDVTRLIPFEISTNDSYALAFSKKRLHFYRTDPNDNVGGQVQE